MKKIERKYLTGCKWCNATGVTFSPPAGMTTGLTDICPVCQGLKTVLVTETYFELDSVFDQSYPDIKTMWHTVTY